jgi:membrane-bound serine protease (ClpP class)
VIAGLAALMAAAFWPGASIAHATSAAAAAPLQAAPSLGEQLLALVTNPNVAYLLLVFGLLGLVGELVTPGTGAPGILGAICLVLAFVGLGHLPTNWGGVLLIVVAVGLFLFDLQVPGHALSIGGAVVFILGSLLLFTPPWVAAPVEAAVRLSPLLALATTAGVAGFFMLGVAVALRSRNAPIAVGRETVIGRTGVVRQDLSPEGIVHIDGEDWSARAADDCSIPAGTRVPTLCWECSYP